MTDRERSRLRGPVRSVRSEYASFDPQTRDWGPFKQGPTQVYDVDGRLEGRPRVEDAGVTTRDERGLRTTINRLGPQIDRPPGLEWGMGFDPASLVDVLTRYDAADRPVDIVYRAAQGGVLHRIELTYTGDGRLSRERVLIGDAFGRGAQAHTAGTAEPLSAQQVEEFAADLRMTMPDGVFTTMEYEYDTRGRVSERRTTMAGLAETLETYSYDDRDNVIEEHHEEAAREAGIDRSGRRITRNETSSESWNRHEYRYDVQGNWVEKVTLHREPPEPGFRRSSLTRRTITYF